MLLIDTCYVHFIVVQVLELDVYSFTRCTTALAYCTAYMSFSGVEI